MPTFLRMTVDQTEVRELPTRVDVEPPPPRALIPTWQGDSKPGSALVTDPPLSWRFARPRPLERDPTDPRFTRADGPDGLHPSEAAVDMSLDACARYRDVVAALADSPNAVEAAVGAGELDIAKKITVQKGFRASGIIVSLIPRGPALPPAWVDTVRSLARLYAASTAFGGDVLKQQPFDTNAGWPSFTRGFAPKLLSALVYDGAAVGPPLVTQLHEYANALNVPAASVGAYGLGFRQGPRNKFEPYLVHQDGGRWTATLEVKGAWPRARQVFMAPYGANRRLRPLAARFQNARRRIPGLWHAGSDDDRSVAHADARGWVVAESDISGYDTHVTAEMQAAVADALSAAWPDMAPALSLWLSAERRPVVTSYSPRDTSALVVNTFGGTHSGLLLTSEIGTFVAAASALYVLGKLLRLRDPVASWTQGEFMLLVAGDDVLVGTPKPLDVDAWAAAWDGVGLPCELIEGRRFLMKHRVFGTSYPVGARVLQQTLFNEHPINGRDAPIMRLAAFVARTEKPIWPSCAPAVDAALRESAFAPIAPSIIQARGRLTERKGEYERALQRLANTSWFQTILRDAEYSPGASAMLEVLYSMGMARPSEAADVAKIHVLERRLKTCSTWTAADRLRYATFIWHEILGQHADPSIPLEATEDAVASRCLAWVP